jgi:hypothetical protein
MVKKKAVKKSMGVRENSYSLLELNQSLLNKERFLGWSQTTL